MIELVLPPTKALLPNSFSRESIARIRSVTVGRTSRLRGTDGIVVRERQQVAESDVEFPCSELVLIE
jgi:hypothetical protein